MDYKALYEAELKRNEQLKAQAQAKVRVSISDKGAIMLSGLRRFPITLYVEEWEAAFSRQEQIRALFSEAKAKSEARRSA
jgi:hypothetical protein